MDEGESFEAAALRGRGLEVAVYGVPAYSTLGKLDWLGGDPLLNTFIGWPEGELARLVFHELAHQVVYAEGDTTFNESFAVPLIVRDVIVMGSAMVDQDSATKIEGDPGNSRYWYARAGRLDAPHGRRPRQPGRAARAFRRPHRQGPLPDGG